MSQFDLQLIEYEKILRSAGMNILSRLNPGFEVSNSEYEQLALPPQAIYLYRWHNGVNPQPGDRIGDLCLFLCGIFLSIQKAYEVQKLLGENESGWGPGRFPLFESGGGEFILIEKDALNEKYGFLFFHSIGATDFDTVITMYDSLLALITTHIECFQKKAYYFEDNILRRNRLLEVKISKKLNPLSEYWKHF